VVRCKEGDVICGIDSRQRARDDRRYISGKMTWVR